MASLTLVPSLTPPEELVQRMLNRIVLGQFAGDVEMARAMWRKYRDLVEAPEFPEYLRDPLMAEFGNEPDDDFYVGPDPDVELARKQAHKLAREEMRHGRR